METQGLAYIETRAQGPMFLLLDKLYAERQNTVKTVISEKAGPRLGRPGL